MRNKNSEGLRNTVIILVVLLLTVAGTFLFVKNAIDKNDKNNQKLSTQTDIKDKQSSAEGNVNEQNTPVIPEKPKEPEESRVSFVACGDVIIHSTLLADSQTLAQGTDKAYNFVPMFENVADIIKDADIAYVNQESPYGGTVREYTGYPMFNTPDQEGYDLMELGFDIINLANNHMLDCRTAGYQRTIDFWKDKPVTYIGGYENWDDFENIRVIEKDGIKIAMLSYTYGTNGMTLASGSPMIIPLCDESGNDDIDRQTKKAREIADIVMVSVHWGHEDWFEPNALQKQQMQIMVNNGVDVIIGTHPHVLQPMMWQERPDGGKTLVMYSIGNFISGMLYSRNMLGGIAGFDIVKKGEEEAYIDAPYFIPTYSHCNTSWRGFKIYKFSEYTREMFETHRCRRISDPGTSYESVRAIIDKTIPQEFLIEDFYKNDNETGVAA